MAKAFSTKQFFKKIYQPTLLSEYYKKHEITAIFEITESTPRKNVVAIMSDFHASLSPEQKIEVESILPSIFSLATANGRDIFENLLKEKQLSLVTKIECTSDLDFSLYYHLFHQDIFDEALFLNAFYLKPNYMLYEAREVEKDAALFALTELGKEFKRIANKEDRTTECSTESQIVGDTLYIKTTFDGNVGENGKKREEFVRIVYKLKEKEVLIAYTGSTYEKLIFLDTFLRVVCKDGYTEKVESFDMTPCKQEQFDFSKTNKGTPLLTWKIRSVTISLPSGEKQKKKVRLTLPSGQQENGMSPLFSCLTELGIREKWGSFTIENISFAFMFTDKRKADKVVAIQASISPNRASLCPLFYYHIFGRKLLKDAGISLGFIEAVKKEKEDVTKKWEV